MMSVALWVGCIAFSLMYPLTEYTGKLKSGAAWWLSKASVLYAIAVAQALVMVAALHVINGFDPARMGQTLLVACVASVTFMSVMYFFTNLMGKVGSFLMLVFMVIQLAGSVGTYPLELSGSFVKYLHDWVPFTYTVTAFRRAICGGGSVTGCLAYLAVWLVVFTLLTILVFTVRARRIKAEKAYPDGLAGTTPPGLIHNASPRSMRLHGTGRFWRRNAAVSASRKARLCSRCGPSSSAR